MNAIRQLLRRVKADGTRRPDSVETTAMGVRRAFDAYDLGKDTFVFERGIESRLSSRASVLVAAKSALRRRARGHVLSITTGNHAVAAMPLLDGRFWRLSALRPAERGEALVRHVVCANVAGAAIELSQREVSTAELVDADAWLVGGLGLSYAAVVMAERNEATLEHYRRLGQEWRVRPLAWTEGEMRVALAASRKRIGSRFRTTIRRAASTG